MIYVTLPTTTEEKRLTYYLAMEEYVARHMDSDDYFFMWQVTPTVIFGRNQLIQSEVNLEYCRTHGINTFRRKSGGGCVYADKSNIMFSYITHDENVNLTFSKYIGMVVDMLRKLGVLSDSKRTQRYNDWRPQSVGQCVLPHTRSKHRTRHHALRHQHAEYGRSHNTFGRETRIKGHKQCQTAHHAA